MLRVAIALVLSSMIAPAFAQQIVKCTDTNGRIEYRNSPCPSGTRREAVEVSNLSIIEADRRGAGDRRMEESTRSPRTSANPAPASPLLTPGSERGGIDRNSPNTGTTETSPRGPR